MYGKTNGYIFQEKAVNGDRESAIIDTRTVESISLIYKWTDNLTGSFEVWTSNDEDEPGGGDIGFWETAATFTTNPAGTPNTAEQKLDTPNKFYMIKFDHTAATAGALYMNISLKERAPEIT